MDGDGFGYQSYLMIHLLTLENLLVQFQHKNNTSSFSQCIYKNDPLPKCISVALQFNNVSTIQQHVRYFDSELNDGRYVNVLKNERNDDR